MRMSGRIFLFEGADYTGKTSVAKYLASVLPNGQYVHSPSGKTHITHAIYDLLKQDDEHLTADIKTLLFLTTNIININTLNKLKREGHTLLVDRSILSMLVYQDINQESFHRLSGLFDIPTLDVDHVFLFHATESAIMARYMIRQTRDNMDEFFIKRMTAIAEKYTKYAPLLYPAEKLTTVDTTNTNMMESCAWAEKYIKTLILAHTPSRTHTT